jgi:protein-tyrosine-phosphatase
MLPATALGTTLAMLLVTTSMGWWPLVTRRQVLGRTLPLPGPRALASGTATAIIIGTTTLAYTIDGTSIVFVLLLLRGGVLIMSPLIDAMHGRRVSWPSWIGLGLSLLALGIGLADSGRKELSLLAVLNVAAYLTGYFIRLPIMSAVAKSHDEGRNLRYFVEEHLLAAPTLLLLLGLFALIGEGPELVALRRGFTSFFLTSAVLPALLVGLLYEAVYVFGTWIYLHPQENTLCIPINRSSSLLSGVAASYLLMYLAGAPPPSVYQLLSAGIIILAILVWSLPGLMVARGTPEPSVRARRILFVCSGNTCRSPMAEALGRAEMAARLERLRSHESAPRVHVLSAGTTATEGKPMTPEAVWALDKLGITALEHRARRLTLEMIDEAEVIYCVTRSLREQVIQMRPEATAKTHCLDSERDIPDPIGSAREAYLETAAHLQRMVRQRFDELGFLSSAREH